MAVLLKTVCETIGTQQPPAHARTNTPRPTHLVAALARLNVHDFAHCCCYRGDSVLLWSACCCWCINDKCGYSVFRRVVVVGCGRGCRTVRLLRVSTMKRAAGISRRRVEGQRPPWQPRNCTHLCRYPRYLVFVVVQGVVGDAWVVAWVQVVCCQRCGERTGKCEE